MLRGVSISNVIMETWVMLRPPMAEHVGVMAISSLGAHLHLLQIDSSQDIPNTWYLTRCSRHLFWCLGLRW